ncbi:folate-binding protein YgfZ [Erythrobacter sp. KY5]|uniref:CAF17-like 4Fe-4S cluster assembly/insertion protein YgfZ n=1 Tax=Erythrobacter sp. KY5 TaxID=2011159 RepID=UPI000DBF0916|nr:folate-binding protein [Erythrobacter sp. KY5]AWW74230.1 folate-binding protein YgfZ [Erythrobacter sp. KY5]
MTANKLNDRAIIRLAATDDGEDVRGFLQGLVTNDVSGELPVYAALLSAQGKAMFDFFVWEGEDGVILLDCEAVVANDLAKRLSLYRLRRKIDIVRDETQAVFWSREMFDGAKPDPRLSHLGYRAVAARSEAEPADQEYLAHRLSLGVPEGRSELADILWLETNAVELHGVSFEKGCYVGQENTARMNWRQKVNRRLVVVPLERSEEKRRKASYPDLGLAIDHLRVADLDPATLPQWQAAGIAE